MKYISNNSLFENWQKLINFGQSHKAAVNKIFGFLELLRNIGLTVGEEIKENQQYSITSSNLSNSLQALYSFSSDQKKSSSHEALSVIFPHGWQQNVATVFLRSKTLPIGATAVICMQNDSFNDESDVEDIVEAFRKTYHIGIKESIFFHEDGIEVTFASTPVDRDLLFNSFKDLFGNFDTNKRTVGFIKEFFAKQAGELTAGPFIQPLYSGQENLKCLLLANFDLEQAYNITQNPGRKSLDKPQGFLPRNKILYGAPGTGKSFELRSQAESCGFESDNTVRITFHPNYSYQMFVGTYKPTPIYKTSNNSTDKYYASNKKDLLELPFEPLIDYSFVPGPFINILIDSLNNPGTDYMLVIEEINRANVSAVFGDVFQLLDRNSSGESEYGIEFNYDVKIFLESMGCKSSNIKIPSNLYIWATMNSADQGVLPLDSAFKRRWSFEYLAIDAKITETSTRTIIFQKQAYSWNKFRNSLNNALKVISISEDKLIGPFFLSIDELSDEDAVTNKLLLYLRDDVVRHNPEMLFRQRAFSDIVQCYKNGEEIFINVKSETWVSDVEEL